MRDGVANATLSFLLFRYQVWKSGSLAEPGTVPTNLETWPLGILAVGNIICLANREEKRGKGFITNHNFLSIITTVAVARLSRG